MSGSYWYFIVFALILIAYASLIIYFLKGWLFGIKRYSKKGLSDNGIAGLSIIIAFRNESNRLSVLLDCLKKQSLSKPYEVIFIDDHSEDDSSARILSFIEKNHLHDYYKLKRLSKGCFGKAEAIQVACLDSMFEHVLLTDADCFFGINWACKMSLGLENQKEKFVIGMVVPEEVSSISKSFFCLDFLSLTASGAGAALQSRPFICSGANMAFSKSLWFKYYEYRKTKGYKSGDDVFFLHFVKNNHIADIIFNSCPETFVETAMPDSWFDFLFQRARWGGKANSYIDTFSVFVSVVVLLINLLLVATLITAFYYSLFLKAFGVIWFGKAIIDFLFLFKISKYVNRLELIKYYLLFSLIYPFYIVMTLFIIVFNNVHWKGRKV